ncbi:MAG: hypothetical protein ABIK93_07060 [candidate division WOR-3 bacterium]
MKKLAALCLIAAIFLVLSCQESAQVKAEREKMAEQIKALEGKVTELGAKVEQLTADYTKHYEEFHAKKAPAKPEKPAPKAPAVKPPTRK